MANFRNFCGLAGMALVFSGLAYGQASCSASAIENIIRGESTNDVTGDLILKCTNNAQIGAVGGPGQVMNIQLFATTGVTFTSKVIDTTNGYSESVAWTGSVQGSLPVTYNPANAVLGTVSATGNSITFVGLPVPLIGASNSAYFYVDISNIRVNASGLTTITTTGAPPGISVTAIVSGAPVIQLSTSATVGLVEYALGGATFYKSTGQATPPGTGSNSFVICTPQSPTSAVTPLVTNTGLAFDVKISEAYASAFRVLSQEASPVQLTAANEPTANVPAAAVTVSNAATSDTRFQIQFTNVPSGVTLYTQQAAIPSVGASTAIAQYTTSLTGAFAPATGVAPTSGSASVFAQIPVSSGSATAVFDITSSDLAHLDSFNIPIYVQFAANSVAASTTAISTVISMAPTGAPTNEPNFNASAGSSITTKTSIFSSCATNLLFPFVTNQLGFDTGIAIANTGTDPFGSLGAGGNQAGTCTLNFYGAVAPSAAVVTANVPSGSVNAFVLSGVAAGFQGYMIAQCSFQFAHGFAFITDGVGANGGLSQGYLAGVIPDVNITAGRSANVAAPGTGAGEVLGN